MDKIDKYLNEANMTKSEYIKSVKKIGDSARKVERAWQEFVEECITETWDYNVKDRIVKDLSKIEKSLLNDMSKVTSVISHTFAMNMKK